MAGVDSQAGEAAIMDDEQTKLLAELNTRRQVALIAVRLMAAEKVDPRAREAEEHYRAQLAQIDKRIEAITGKPPPIVVGLKTAVLFPKSGDAK